MENPIVTFEMENGDKMVAELYPELAPNTVNNFIALVQSGFYDGLVFHRVIPGFMIFSIPSKTRESRRQDSRINSISCADLIVTAIV